MEVDTETYTETETETETSDASNWRKVVDMVQTAFQDGRLAEEATWQAVVLIPKGGGDSRRIGLIEVLRKTVEVILNLCLSAATTLHYVLNGLGYCCRMGTASLKKKVLQQLTAMRDEVLCTLFLDLHKAYNALDRDIYLGILK